MRTFPIQNSIVGLISLSRDQEGDGGGFTPTPQTDTYKSELWSVQGDAHHRENSWSTNNTEYGVFPPKKVSSKRAFQSKSVDWALNRERSDGGPFMASTYQVGFNLRPKLQDEKWLNSWQGHLQRKQPRVADSMRELRDPYKDKQLTEKDYYQLGYNQAVSDQDPYHKYNNSAHYKLNNNDKFKASFHPKKTYYSSKQKTIPTHPDRYRRSHAGVKLAPLSKLSTGSTSSGSMSLHSHSQSLKNKASKADRPSKAESVGANEKFFNFKFNPYWRAMKNS